MTSAIVIGAGLAGLRCASDLVDAGVDVVVLEARDRVGGRVWSHDFGDGQVCERGAEFIDEGHSEVLALAASLGLRLSTRDASLDPHATLVDAAGRVVPMAMHASIAADLDRWSAALAQPPDADDESLADLIAALGLSVMARLVIGREVRTEFMLPPEQVSRRFAHEQTVRAVGREAHRIVGGNDQLATGLAARLGQRVQLECPVASVHEDGRVVLLDGGELRADAVIAAVPLPVLSRMWPNMPAVLAMVGYGIGGKISVQYGRRVWRDLGRNGTVLSDRSWGHLWETSDDQPGDAGVLTNLLASHDGASLCALPEAPQHVVREIERIFPGTQGLAGERVHTDWTNDPFALGCYATFAPGEMADARAALAEPFGRLWPAGEHADEFAGFMEGALRSGRRTAAAIVAAHS